MVNGKPRHSQSQGSVERANRDIENLLACWQAENNSTNWSKALNIIQFQKNSKWHKGINREPYMALFGRQPAFGLKGLNLPDEVIDGMETEEQLIEALGLESSAEVEMEEEVTEEVVQNEQNIDVVTVPADFQMQSLENIPFIIQQDASEVTEESDVDNGNDIIEDLNNSSMEGCVACSNLFLRPTSEGSCSSCQSPCHTRCLQVSIVAQDTLVCSLCYQKEVMDRERRGTKRKQEQQAAAMLVKSARRYKQASVGDSVMVHLPEVDRGRCEFPNVHAVVVEVNEAGMYKLGTKQGLLKGVYSRNQFEPLPEPLLLVTDVDKETEIALRSAANKQAQGGGQGFVKCGCVKTCQANNCKCKKNNQFCNSRCHKGSKCCLNHE